MTWEYWLISISIGVVALAFVALVVYLIKMLVSIKGMVDDLDQKVHSFDPYFRLVNKAGNVIEKKASNIKQLSEEVEEEVQYERREKARDTTVNTALEVAEWTLLGLALWQKIKERRR